MTVPDVSTNCIAALSALAAAAATMLPPARAAEPAPKARLATPITHVVIIIQENRTPDNLFQGLPGADIAASGTDSKGDVIPLTPAPLDDDYDLGHSHANFVVQYDNGKMDGSDLVTVNCRAKTGCPPQDPQFKYVDPADVAPYLEMAQTYTFGDRMFQSNQGPSFPAHQYLIAGTSTPSAGGAYDNKLASGNPRGPRLPTGCIEAPASQHVPLINPKGVEHIKGVYPCFEHPTLMDLLDQAGHTWSYYAADPAGIWTGPNAIDHIRTGPGWSNVKSPETLVLTDIANGTLADVSWVTPSNLESDHPGGNDGSGPSWVASIVNAIGASPYWQDTAIFITWDDWGGWYDHVAPPIYSSYEAGFRVPLIVVSPYAKTGYVSHVTHTFGSLIKFIEETYDLPSLGYEDATSDDLSDCFSFTQPSRRFQAIKAPHDAAYFLQRPHTDMSADDDDE